MGRQETELFPEEERRVYSLISKSNGITAREIGRLTGIEKKAVNRLLVSSALMRELCYQDREYRWHAVVRQQAPWEGLYEFSGWYGTVGEFLAEGEAEWLARLEEGCSRIGRNLNDTRGLIHSFTDCRKTMLRLFEDLEEMASLPFREWEIVFELRMNRARWIRIYADVLVITPSHVFSLEFKMKDTVDPAEVMQAAKYSPFLEVIFGSRFEVIPALVLSAAADLFEFVPIGNTDMILPVVSGDMLFNVFNEYLCFLH